jgi:hypothetical protein
MMIGYDIYDCFTMEHFRFRQRMTLTTKIYCLRLYLNVNFRPYLLVAAFPRMIFWRKITK